MTSPDQQQSTNYTYSYDDTEMLTIQSDKMLCESKRQILYSLYAKHKYFKESTNLSSYYSRALEVIKHILQYINNNDIYVKQNIRFYDRRNEQQQHVTTHLNEILGDVTLYVFDSIDDDDDIEHDISESQIREFVSEIEERTTELLVHQDFFEFIMFEYDNDTTNG